MPRKPGRPPKYLVSTRLEVIVPAELKEFLRALSLRKGKSISELVVEALLSYYKEVEIPKKKRKEKTAREILAQRKLKKIKKRLNRLERAIGVIEEARRSGSRIRKGTMVIDVEDFARGVKADLDDLINEILGLERIIKSRKLTNYMKKALELEDRLEVT